jgi:hypothetical protein
VIIAPLDDRKNSMETWCIFVSSARWQKEQHGSMVLPINAARWQKEQHGSMVLPVNAARRQNTHYFVLQIN